MLANVNEILTDVRSLINESTERFWKDDEIIRWINEAAEDFSFKTKCLSSYYYKILTEDDIIDDREIRLNPDFIALDEGGVLYNDKPLTQTSLKHLDEWGKDWRSRTGTPTHFYFRGDYIGFYPKPSIGDKVSYYGIERAPYLDSDIVEPLSGDYRVIALRKCLRDYAVAMCWYKKNEIAKYQEMMARYEMNVFNVQNLLAGHKNQGAKIIPARRRR